MINIDYADRRPIYEQLEQKIKDLILMGVLEPEAQLPSVRSLAMELSINPNTIQRAYSELERDGIIYVIKGRGNFVAPIKNLVTKQKDKVKQQLLDLITDAKKADITEKELHEYVTEGYKG